MRFFASLLLVLSFSSRAFGQETGSITQVFRDQKRAVATLSNSDDLDTRHSLIVTTANGEACVVSIVEISFQKKFLLDLSTCSASDQIVAGTRVSKPEFQNVVKTAPPVTAPVHVPVLFQVPAPIQPVSSEIQGPPAPVLVQEPRAPVVSVYEPRAETLHGHFGLTYNTSGSLMFEDASMSGTSGNFNGEYEVELENSFGYSVGVTYSPRHSWGFNIGVAGDFKRRVKSEKATQSGYEPAEYTLTEDYYVRFTYLNANAIYRWDNFYLPFGLNYAVMNSDDELYLFKHATSNPGVQAGVGFYANDFLAFEFLIQATSFRTGGVSNSGDYYELGTGTFVTGSLALKIVP